MAADGRAEQSGQGVALDTLGQFGVGEGQGLAERIRQGSVGTGLAAGFSDSGPGREGFKVRFGHT